MPPKFFSMYQNFPIDCTHLISKSVRNKRITHSCRFQKTSYNIEKISVMKATNTKEKNENQ